MLRKYNLTQETIQQHFADTRDTLCYATNDNQSAVSGMLQVKADLAVVVGGYKSSNTSHLAELCEEKLPTYYIESEAKILSPQTILHYNFHSNTELVTENYLPEIKPVTILITSGASCPDAVVESVIRKLVGFFPASKTIEELLPEFL
jgi:4-hydroxy-3-methylbut-2-enyl diphosphate reductase